MVKALRVLTGFKYIGEKLDNLKIKNQMELSYLVLKKLQDIQQELMSETKMQLLVSRIIAEMATTLKNNGSSIYNEIIKIYENMVWRLETTIPVTPKKEKMDLKKYKKL